jgi:hypothetical protein
MNKWKVAFFLILPLLLLSLLCVLYVVLDNGTSNTYLRVSYDDQVEVNKVLAKMVVKAHSDHSQQDLLSILRSEYPDAFIVKEGNTLIIGSLVFEFNNDRLEQIR